MMDACFVEYLEQRKALVDSALDRRLPSPDAAPERVHEAMRYAALSAGKRLRPILALAVGEIGGAATASVLDAACAIECIHTASLILDDLPSMDNALTRRDRPCTHLEFGEATALLAAMGLTVMAFDLVAVNAEACGEGIRAAPAVHKLARAAGTAGLICGQHLDLRCCDGQMPVAEIQPAYEQKTGALFLASVQLPAYLVGMDERETGLLEEYARKVGLAFQITDDVLDASGSPEDEGKSTFVTQLGVEGAKHKVDELIAEAVQAVGTLGDRAEPLRKLAIHVKTRKS